MKKLAFIIPWYSDSISGGAEIAIKNLCKNLKKRGVNLEILTTCIKDSNSSWSKNYFKKGLYIENEIPVRRFKVKKVNKSKFIYINKKLIDKMKLSPKEKNWYFNEMINCPTLYEYIEKNKDNYSLFVFSPYLFSPTYYGISCCPSKSVLIPCFHDEPYAYLEEFKQLYSKVLGMIFYSNEEKKFAEKVYDLNAVKTNVLGLGIDTSITYNIDRVRKKYNIQDPFVLYAGRKNSGKCVDILFKYFNKYKNKNSNNLKLVLISGGKLKVPDYMKDDVIDLGFVSIEDKYDLMAASLLLCQPSKLESFSIVIMESWICKRPVLVNKQCLITTDFVKRSNGGLYFNNYIEFEYAINYLLNNKEISDIIGKQGEKFVKKNFDWDIVCKKYIEFFNKLDQKQEG